MSREGIARSLSMADVAIEIPGIEKTCLIDMQQHDTLIALAKAAMKAQMEDLIERAIHLESDDDHT